MESLTLKTFTSQAYPVPLAEKDFHALEQCLIHLRDSATHGAKMPVLTRRLPPETKLSDVITHLFSDGCVSHGRVAILLLFAFTKKEDTRIVQQAMKQHAPLFQWIRSHSHTWHEFFHEKKPSFGFLPFLAGVALVVGLRHWWC